MSLIKSDLKVNAVVTNTGSRYAWKLLAPLWVNVNGSEVCYWMVRLGLVKDGDFVSTGDENSVTVMTDQAILDGYDMKWSKEDRFKDGDFLSTEDGQHVFLYRKTKNGEKVWKLTGTDGSVYQSTLIDREQEFGTLKLLTRGWSGEDFNFTTIG